MVNTCIPKDSEDEWDRWVQSWGWEEGKTNIYRIRDQVQFYICIWVGFSPK